MNNLENTTKAIIVARACASKDGDDSSIAAQVERLKKYSQKKGLEVIKEFFLDKTSCNKQQDKMTAIINFIAEQNGQVAVCFDKTDLLFRKVFNELIYSLYDKELQNGLELHFASDDRVISSKSSAAEKDFFSINLSLAKHYFGEMDDAAKRRKIKKNSAEGALDVDEPADAGIE